MILDDDSDDEDDDFDEKKVTVPLTVTMIVIAGKLLNMSISLRSSIVKAMWSIILQLCESIRLHILTSFLVLNVTNTVQLLYRFNRYP